MILNFKHKGLRLLWEEGKSNKLPTDQIEKIERMLEVIDSIQKVPDDFAAFQSWNLHKLSGDLNNYWSLKVNKNYRIIFKFDGQNAFNVDYTDYH
ncbi:MAG: type II toxin-antitoxin system RelE/ParE family toxin [Mucilaginibacter sp.]